MMHKSVLLIGPLLPPVGGVSVHLDRLAHLLKSDFQVNFLDEAPVVKPGVPNIRKITPRQYLQLIRENDLIHVHSGLRFLVYLHIFIAKLMFKNVVVTVHSYKETSRFIRTFDRLIYTLPDITVVVNNIIGENLRPHNNMVIKNAFLPPIMEKELPVPEFITEWINNKKKGGYQIAIANAFRLTVHNNQDLYGMDLCIDAINKLRSENKKVALIFTVCNPKGEIDLTAYEKRIEESGLADIFFVQKSPISFVNLILQTDMVLRPTNTDGDALTIREAIHLGKPVIASDAVPRPPGTRLFKNRCADSLAMALADLAATNPTNAVPITNSNENYAASFYFFREQN